MVLQRAREIGSRRSAGGEGILPHNPNWQVLTRKIIQEIEDGLGPSKRSVGTPGEGASKRAQERTKRKAAKDNPTTSQRMTPEMIEEFHDNLELRRFDRTDASD